MRRSEVSRTGVYRACQLTSSFATEFRCCSETRHPTVRGVSTASVGNTKRRSFHLRHSREGGDTSEICSSTSEVVLRVPALRRTSTLCHAPMIFDQHQLRQLEPRLKFSTARWSSRVSAHCIPGCGSVTGCRGSDYSVACV